MQGKFTITWKHKSVEDKNKPEKSKIRQKAQGGESDMRLELGEEAKTKSDPSSDTCSSLDEDALEYEDE